MTDESKGYQLNSGKTKSARKRRNALFSGNIALIMVFCNGLILTFVAYLTLNAFVGGMIGDGLAKLSLEAESNIQANFEDIEHSLTTLSTIMSVADQRHYQNVSTLVKQSNVDLAHYDKLFWVYKRDERWDVLVLHENNRAALLYDNFLNKPDHQLVDYVRKISFVSPEQVRIVPDLKGVRSYKSEEGSLHTPLGIMEVVERNGEVEGYLFGVTQFNVALNQWVKEQENLLDMEIIYNRSYASFRLYKFLDEQNTSGKKPILHSSTKEISFGDEKVLMRLDFTITEHEAFMRKIPLVMFVFGMSLTLIGTLYVRNNQKQSKRLSKMNRTLAQKNYDLNAQIKEGERLNNAIKKSERENRAMLDSVSDIIFETNRDGQIRFLNHTWERVTHSKVSATIGKNLFDLIYGQDREEQRLKFEALLNGQDTEMRSFTRVRCEDGSYRSVELGFSMLRRDEDGNVYVVGTITDIEERRRTEKALNEVERKYKTIVENVAGGIYQLSPDGKYLSANPAMAKILGFETPKEVMENAHNVNERLYKDTRKRLKYLRDLQDFKEMQTQEFEIYTKDGGEVWVSESARAVFDEDGVLQYFEGSINDITERKQAEAKLHNAKVESDLASRAKSEFLTNMSHELRTPLNAIIGFSEIIKNEAFGSVGSKEYIEYANDIYEGGQRLLNVINEILDVSRIEAGERVLNEGVVDVRSVVNGALQLMDSKVKEGGLTVINSVSAAFPKLIGEELAVKQMVINLLSNAVKFTSAEGRITISAEIGNNGNMRLSVTDTGIGMNEEEIEKALSPFGQVENKLSKSSSGTGLGLTLVDSLIRMHDGRLELLSQKGIGTTATLIFPSRRVSRRGDQVGSFEQDQSSQGIDAPKSIN